MRADSSDHLVGSALNELSVWNSSLARFDASFSDSAGRKSPFASRFDTSYISARMRRCMSVRCDLGIPMCGGSSSGPNARLKRICSSSSMSWSRSTTTACPAIAASTAATSSALGGSCRSAPQISAANSGWSFATVKRIRGLLKVADQHRAGRHRLHLLLIDRQPARRLLQRPLPEPRAARRELRLADVEVDRVRVDVDLHHVAILDEAQGAADRRL